MSPTAPLMNHDRVDLIEMIEGLLAGDPIFLAAFGALLSIIAFFAVHNWLTGESFVKPARERRRARERRKHVIWKYEADDD